MTDETATDGGTSGPPERPGSNPPPGSPEATEVTRQIAEFYLLYRAGALTEEEFKRAKRRTLNWLSLGNAPPAGGA